MKMYKRVGYYKQETNTVIIYPVAWQELGSEFGLCQNDVIQIGCQFYRVMLHGDDEDVTPLVAAFVEKETGENVDAIVAKNERHVAKLLQHVNKRTFKANVISLPEDDYIGAMRP